MSVIVIKPYVPKGSLLSKIAIDMSPVWVQPKFNEGNMVFVIGEKRYQGKRANIADPDSEIVCEIPECDIVLSNRHDGYQISPNQVFDRSNPRDMLILQMAKDNGFLAESRERVNTVEGHRFFVLDEEYEADKTSIKIDKTYEAISLMTEMSQEDKYDLARILGQYVSKMSDKKVNAFLKKTAVDNPDSIILSLADKDYKSRVFVKKLMEKNILRNDRGKIMYQDNLIGASIDDAVLYVRDPRNASDVTAWGRLLNRDVVVDVAEEVVKKSVGRPSVSSNKQ